MRAKMRRVALVMLLGGSVLVACGGREAPTPAVVDDAAPAISSEAEDSIPGAVEQAGAGGATSTADLDALFREQTDASAGDAREAGDAVDAVSREQTEKLNRIFGGATE